MGKRDRRFVGFVQVVDDRRIVEFEGVKKRSFELVKYEEVEGEEVND